MDKNKIYVKPSYYKGRYDKIYKKEDPWGAYSNEIKKLRDVFTLDLIKNKSFNFVIDLGCGEGHLTEKISHYAKKVLGIDFSKKAIERAQDRYPHISFVEDDIKRVEIKKYGNNIDLICLLSIICPFNPEEKIRLIENVNRALSQEGYILVNTRIVSNKEPLSFKEYYDFDSLDALLNFLKPYFEIKELRAVEAEVGYDLLVLPRREYDQWSNKIKKMIYFFLIHGTTCFLRKKKLARLVLINFLLKFRIMREILRPQIFYWAVLARKRRNYEPN